MGDLDDDFGVDAAGQGVVHKPAHQGSALAGDQPVPAQVLPLHGGPGAERVRLGVDDEDQRLALELQDLDAGNLDGAWGAGQADLGAAAADGFDDILRREGGADVEPDQGCARVNPAIIEVSGSIPGRAWW